MPPKGGRELGFSRLVPKCGKYPATNSNLNPSECTICDVIVFSTLWIDTNPHQNGRTYESFPA